MTAPLQQSSSQALMRETGLHEKNIERRRRIVGLDAKDVANLVEIRDLVMRHADDFVTTFFDHLAGLDEASPLFTSQAILSRARQLKRDHLMAMVQGEYGVKYVEQRLELGSLYAQVGLDTRVFLGAYQALLRHMDLIVTRQFAADPEAGVDLIMTLQKLAFFDIGIIIDIMVPEREHVIRQQQEAIRELSTPALPISKHLLLLPLVGPIDSRRAQLLTDSLLASIRTNRTKVVVMDLTGVSGLDSKVANHLLQTVAAARIMGAQMIVTGLSAEVAQSLVTLGIDLSALTIKGDLQEGLAEAQWVLEPR